MAKLPYGITVNIESWSVRCLVCLRFFTDPRYFGSTGSGYGATPGTKLSIVISPSSEWVHGVAARMEQEITTDQLVAAAVAKGWTHILCPDHQDNCSVCPLLVCPTCLTTLKQVQSLLKGTIPE